MALPLPRARRHPPHQTRQEGAPAQVLYLRFNPTWRAESPAPACPSDTPPSSPDSNSSSCCPRGSGHGPGMGSGSTSTDPRGTAQSLPWPGAQVNSSGDAWHCTPSGPSRILLAELSQGDPCSATTGQRAWPQAGSGRLAAVSRPSRLWQAQKGPRSGGDTARERHGWIQTRGPKVWGELRTWPGTFPGSAGEELGFPSEGNPPLLWVVALTARGWGQDSPVHQLGPDEVVHMVGKAESHRGRRPPAQELRQE